MLSEVNFLRLEMAELNLNRGLVELSSYVLCPMPLNKDMLHALGIQVLVHTVNHTRYRSTAPS